VRSGIDHGARGGKDNDDWPAGGQGRLAVFDTTMRGGEKPLSLLIGRADAPLERDDAEGRILDRFLSHEWTGFVAPPSHTGPAASLAFWGGWPSGPAGPVLRDKRALERSLTILHLAARESVPVTQQPEVA
jgi:hypothetical protein